MTDLIKREYMPEQTDKPIVGPDLQLVSQPEAPTEYERFLRPATEQPEGFQARSASALAIETKEAFTKYQTSKPEDHDDMRASIRMQAVKKIFKVYKLLPITVQNETLFSDTYRNTEREVKDRDFTDRELIADLAEQYDEHPAIVAIDTFRNMSKKWDDGIDMKRTALLLIHRHTAA